MSEFSLFAGNAPAVINVGDSGATFTNYGPSLVYYASGKVSSTVNDGSLTAGASVTLSGSPHFTIDRAQYGGVRADVGYTMLPPSATTSGVSTATGASIGEDAPLWVYGHSYTQDPGVACTAGLEFYKKVKTRRRFSAVTTYGVGSSRIVDNYFDIIGQSDKTPMTGSTWDGTRRGAVILDAEENDIINRLAAGTTVSALTAGNLYNYRHCLTACLAVLTSSGRVECETGTKGGTWAADSASTIYSGGATALSQTNGSTLDVVVTVPASGYVWLIAHVLSTQTPGAFTVTEGATNYLTVTSASQLATQIYTTRPTAGTRTLFPQAFKITATPGTHTFRLTQTSAGWLVPDCFLLPHATPVPIAVVRDPLPVSGGPFFGGSGGNYPVMQANKPQLDAIQDSVVAQFSTATVVDSTITTADIGAADGLHPNDRGMRKMADALLNSAWLTGDVSGLYAAT